MRLHSYSVKAQDVCRWPVFRNDAMVFGVEVEVEPRRGSTQGAILRALGEDTSNFFCKSDGSLTNGVEIVTVPLSLADHRGSRMDWRGTMAPILPLAMSGSRTSNCGMHVHMNRRAVSKLTLAKMLLLMNEPVMQPLIASVAQRANSSWARAHKKEWKDGLNPDSGMRYQPLNVTRHTAEFRIFRGSLRHDRIIKNLEFCAAVAEYCGQSSAKDFLSPVAFEAFVRSHGRDYPALVAFLDEIGAQTASAA